MTAGGRGVAEPMDSVSPQWLQGGDSPPEAGDGKKVHEFHLVHLLFLTEKKKTSFSFYFSLRYWPRGIMDATQAVCLWALSQPFINLRLKETDFYVKQSSYLDTDKQEE